MSIFFRVELDNVFILSALIYEKFISDEPIETHDTIGHGKSDVSSPGFIGKAETFYEGREELSLELILVDFTTKMGALRTSVLLIGLSLLMQVSFPAICPDFERQ